MSNASMTIHNVVSITATPIRELEVNARSSWVCEVLIKDRDDVVVAISMYSDNKEALEVLDTLIVVPVDYSFSG